MTSSLDSATTVTLAACPLNAPPEISTIQPSMPVVAALGSRYGRTSSEEPRHPELCYNF